MTMRKGIIGTIAIGCAVVGFMTMKEATASVAAEGKSVIVPPFYLQSEEAGKSWWSAPLGLSWGKGLVTAQDSQDWGLILLGLGGWMEAKDGLVSAGNWWAFPFVHRWWSEPAQKKDNPSAETYVAAYLSGWETRGDSLKSLYVFPLFSWDENGSWMTLLGGQRNFNGTTNTFYTPLFGVTTGRQRGSCLFPLWSHCRDVDFDAKADLIDAPTLPRETNFWSDDDTVVLLHDFSHSVRGLNLDWQNSASNVYEIVDRYKRGNELLLNYGSERKVTFDLKTRKKLSDVEESTSSFVLWLYQYDHKIDRLNGGEYVRHSAVLRLWDWEKRNGDVSLSLFPGFTYSSGKGGHVKTSFLWRFFRYESDEKNDTSVDFLFIPIWR